MPAGYTSYTPYTWNGYPTTWDGTDSGLLTWGTAQISNSYLTAAETLRNVDAYSNGIIKMFGETLKVRDTFVRRGPAVLSNIVLRSDVLTFAQFLAEDHTVVGNGYGPYKPFIAGDYDLSKALIKISLKREAASQDLRVTAGKFNADRPIITDSGQVTASTGGTVAVSFSKEFLTAPVVSSAFVSSTGVGIVRITGITSTGFNIDLVDNSGTRIAGTIGWIAQGS